MRTLLTNLFIKRLLIIEAIVKVLPAPVPNTKVPKFTF